MSATRAGIEYMPIRLEEWQEFEVRAFRRFHELLLDTRSEHPGLVPETLLDSAAGVDGSRPNDLAAFIWGAGGVCGEIWELFNLINDWGQHVFRWRVWIRVYDEYTKTVESGEEKQENALWNIRSSFIDPIASYCMLQPSTVKDRVIKASSDALHIANMATIHGYRDALHDDKKPNRFLSRDKALNQLGVVGSAREWECYKRFRRRLGDLYGKAYVRDTNNYRNRASHGFAPRFEVGLVTTLMRRVVPVRTLVKGEEGRHSEVPVPGKKAVQYDFGHANPIRYQDAYKANLAQYKIALQVTKDFELLIEEMKAEMNFRPRTRLAKS